MLRCFLSGKSQNVGQIFILSVRVLGSALLLLMDCNSSFLTKPDFLFVSEVKMNVKISVHFLKTWQFLGLPEKVFMPRMWNGLPGFDFSFLWNSRQVMCGKDWRSYLIRGIRKGVQGNVLFSSLSLCIQDNIIFMRLSRVTNSSCTKQKFPVVSKNLHPKQQIPC